MRVGLEFKPQDLWIGAYWEHRPGQPLAPSLPDVRWRELHVWVCIIPMFPIHVVLEAPE